VFFPIEALFGAAGVWYLVGLGATALLGSLFLPRGLWGLAQDRLALELLSVGYRLVAKDGAPAGADQGRLSTYS
jgi:branched-chain amino acid transport system permease protein